MAVSSPSTFGSPPASERRAPSPGTFTRPVSVPRSAEERDMLLDQATRQLRLTDDPAPLMAQLARFIGAASSIWTSSARARLRELLLRGGPESVEPVLREVATTPTVDVSDEAARFLIELVAQRTELAGVLGVRAAVEASPAARAVIVRALGRAGIPSVALAIEGALRDPSPEVRDAAALAVARLGAPGARRTLERQLAREASPVVREAIEAALEGLEAR